VDKRSGALVQKIAMATAAGLAVDPQDNVWIIDSNGGAPHVDKFSVNTDGTLTFAAAITSLVQPLAVAVSPDNTLVLVADGDVAEQVQAYSASSPSSLPLWTLGQTGGYANGPDVSDDKFFFDDLMWPDRKYTVGQRRERTFIAFQPDGTFWVGDTTNFRVQHYASDRTLLGRLMAFPALYNVQTVQGEPTRLLANYLELKIDYDKPLGADNSSWTLVKNWRWGIPDIYLEYNGGVVTPVTMSNGRTYAMMRHAVYSTDGDLTTDPQQDRHVIVELAPTGLRFTGVNVGLDGCGTDNIWDWYYWYLGPDGSCRGVFTPGGAGSPTGVGQQWRMQPVTGFDASNNPIWGAQTTVVETAAYASGDVWVGETGSPWAVTTTGVVGAYAGGLGLGHHFGGVDTKTGKWLFKVAPATGRGHVALTQFPTDGAFDTGNDVTANTGGMAFATGRSFFLDYYGENWSGGETNKYNHFFDDGLMVGQFGSINYFNYALNHVENPDPIPGQAGNACAGPGSCSLVTAPNGSVYIYHGDESQHGGVHRWRIDNLSSITEQKIALTFDGTQLPLPLPPGIDLLKGVPHMTQQMRNDPLYGMPVTDLFPTPLVDGANGWHRNPSTDGAGWSVSTGARVYRRDESADIFTAFSGTNHTASVTRDLLASTDPATATWSLDVDLGYSGAGGMSNLNQGEIDDGIADSHGEYFEVVDDADKVIARFYAKALPSGDRQMFANGAPASQGQSSQLLDLLYRTAPHLNITTKNGQLTFTFGPYSPVTTPPLDPASNWQRPSALRVRCWMGISDYGKTLDLSGLRFTPGP
jgi:hypothetical protein